MKLIHVLPFEIFLGGGERFIKNWMIHSGYESILYAKRPGNGKQLVDIDNTIYYTSYNELIQLLQKHSNDTIIYHSFPEGPVNQIKCKRLIWYVHGAYAFKTDVSRFARPFMCMSNYRPAFTHPSWNNVFIAAIPLGIDTNAFDICKSDNKEAKMRIGIVGRISPEKLPTDFFKALKEFNQKPEAENIEFLHFGAGVNDNFHKEYLKTIQPITNWQYMGSVPHEKSNTIYHNFDILLVPSVTETGSYAMLEAQASGLKVYCLNRDGMPYHVTSQSSLFNNYSDMLNALLDEKKDDLLQLKSAIRKEIVDNHDVIQQVMRLDFTVSL